MNLLPAVSRYFKANLHTHSNISDGDLTPEETVKLYRENGYQILCITDHNIIVNHSDKNTDDFLLLTGVEIDLTDDQFYSTNGYAGQTYHLLMIAKDANNLWMPIVPKPIVPKGRTTFLPYLPFIHNDTMCRDCDLDTANAMIARANELGFLVAYCHPEWSGQRYPDYAELKGLWAMELRNTGAAVGMGMDQNNHLVYQDLLELGNRLCPLGGDDMHEPKYALGSWIMVGAQQLTYDSVIEALEKGDFYASCGPEIHRLTMEDGKLTVSCSDAASICLYSQCRFDKRIFAKPGQVLNSGTFDVTEWLTKSADDPNAFLRVTVYAPDGTYAATRAYWMNELKG